MRPFLYNGQIDIDSTIFLPEEESHHITTVLRLQPGAEIELFDGEGGAAEAEIISIGKQVAVRILGFITGTENIGRSLLVGQGMLKGKKMDLAVQKCTELGVSTFVPFFSSRCQAGNIRGQKEKRHQRWQRIIKSSCGQCGRNHLMDLHEPAPFHELVAKTFEPEPVLKLLFWEEEKDRHLGSLQELAEHGNVMILLGPEGGFSEEEVRLAGKYGYQSVSLGRRILRAETATIATVAILQHLLGNLE